jgi:hypothetical protein
MTARPRPALTYDSLLAAILADLIYCHTRDDLRPSIDAAESLPNFAAMLLDDLTDTDEPYLIFDLYTQLDCLAFDNLLASRFDDFHDAICALLTELQY